MSEPEPSPKIVQAGDPVLRAAAATVPVASFGTPALRSLVDTMIAVMRVAPGVGLAAPQIGVSLRVVVLEEDAERIARLPEAHRVARGRIAFAARAFVNPVLTVLEPEPATFFEGCLSVSGWAALVPRARAVRVDGFDVEGQAQSWEVSGWPARILQHEVDHVNGVLYVDRMLSRTFGDAEQVAKHFGNASPDEVRKALGA